MLTRRPLLTDRAIRRTGKRVDGDANGRGETIRAFAGTLKVVGVRRLPGTHRVFNLTVEGEHVYHVSRLGALTHNNTCGPEGRPPRNAHLAGSKHPVTGIPFGKTGYPDFSGVAKKTAKVAQTGKRDIHESQANAAAGYSSTPDGYTWHHHEDFTTMELVETGIHSKTGHSGGVAALRPTPP